MQIDEEFLNEVGLGSMSDSEKQAFISHAMEELEVRVGDAVSAGMTDDEILYFGQIEDENAAADWLEQKVPDFREKVDQVYADFKQEIASEANEILGR